LDYNKYFNQAESSANENYLNYGGDGGNYPSVDAEFDENIYFEGGYQNQNGAAPTSQPYIITLSNTTTVAITSNIVGKAFENITATDNGVATGMTYSMGISGTTYVELLYTTLNRPFVIGLTYVDASSQAQALNTLQLKVRDANGNEQLKTLVPTIDPYQNQTDIVALRQTFRWDGFTSLAIDVVASGSSTFYFYPSESINPARGLAGQSLARGYGNPNVVRQDKVVLGRGVANALRG
tara:strand:+ start:6907 stop:7620 length:714 start_codon:yes stop_codon:yes gene_type:complete